MSLTPQSLPVPLREEPAGVFRIGKTRVLLELVIHDFQNGARPEDIVRSYPTLDVADVYAVLAYYLRNREEVEQYLHKVDEDAEVLRREIEAGQRPLPSELKDRLAAARIRLQVERTSQEGTAAVSAAG